MAEVESINGNPIVAEVASESIVPVVDAWLTAHPEATATVADGSITTVKLADGAVTDAKLAQQGGVLSRLYSMVEHTTLRNGTPTSTGNPNYVSTAAAFAADHDHYVFIADVAPQTGYSYLWFLYLNSTTTTYVKTTGPVLEYDVASTTNTIQVGLTLERDGASGTYYPLRIANVGTDAIHIWKVYTTNAVNSIFDAMPMVVDEPSWTSNRGIVYYNGNLSNSTMVKASDYIPVGIDTVGIRIALPVFASSTTFGMVFYDENKTYLSGVQLSTGNGSYSVEKKYIAVPDGALFFRTVWFIDTATYGSWSCERVRGADASYVYVAASDSPNNAKAAANYVCTGTNDEDTIARAMRYALFNEVNEVRFARGTYVIDSFPFEDASGIKIAVPLGVTNTGNAREMLVRIVGDGYGTFRKTNTLSELYSGAVFKVSDDCYEALDDSTQYAVFGCATNHGNRLYPGTKCKFEHIGIVLPDNQKKIICIDGWYMSALSFDDVHLMALAASIESSGGSLIPAEDLHVAVDGCYGVRGLQGNNYGTANMWENSFAWGFHTGFQVVGEHIVGISLGARFCNYGYRFGAFTDTWAPRFTHPNTLINCCDECNFNLPAFGRAGYIDNWFAKQPITIIDFNVELYSQYFTLGGARATETRQGENYGSITFSIVGSSSNWANNLVSEQFWADGSGNNVRTVNSAHALSGATAQRELYAPTYMQQYYDTDLRKLLVYDGSEWVDMNGSAVD